ncbi:MAG: hypothetical protein JRN52_11610 [Nitrososphaerota archaeon]|nr:hypothetical protein [Nitrososphaerota archaeon]
MKNSSATKESRRHGGFTPVSMLIGMSVVKPRLECFVMVTGLDAFAIGIANGVRERREGIRLRLQASNSFS